MKHLSPLKAIRKHCLACAGRPKDVRTCSNTECKLHRYRMGKNPSRAGIGPIKGATRSIPVGVLPNPATDSDKIRVKKAYAMPEKIVQPGASGGEIRLVKMEAVGKVQMLDKTIIIELTPVG